MVYMKHSSHQHFVDVLLVLVCVVLVAHERGGRGVWAVKIPNAQDFSGIDEAAQADDDEFVHDLAVKLKKDFADDLVSDLFATSYGLEKVARVRSPLFNNTTVFVSNNNNNNKN